MGDKKGFLILSLIVVLAVMALSCKTLPPKQGISEDTQFNHGRISQAVYDLTREEVRLFVEKLNQIIRARDYNAWLRTLSQEYIDLYSSQAKLREISEEPLMKRAGIVLRNLNDFFTRVFIPSRSPDRVQIDNIDIEFVTSTKVRAFTTRTNNAGQNQREVLYDLEKINNDWKIIN
ncbi:MAG: hypothetical protein FWB73_01375 [Treponema sp.]|nr:hypothetical protein [Treponema sp.]